MIDFIKKAKAHRISRISVLHAWKLLFRSTLFMICFVVYIYNKVKHTGHMFGGMEDQSLLLDIVWLIFDIEMLLRFLPSKTESMGCQKVFGRNYIPTEETEPEILSYKRVALIFLGWIGFNSIFGVMYLLGIIDWGIMVLLSLAYSVCDMICILFFCPFQTWFMKNKCCGTCRIYNWDFAMMFTPLIFVKGIHTWSMLLLSIGLFVYWEVVAYLHPERFAQNTNAALECRNCPEKLCAHKKQLQHFLKVNQERFNKRLSNCAGLSPEIIKNKAGEVKQMAGEKAGEVRQMAGEKASGIKKKAEER